VSTNPRDKARRFALLKAELLAAARAAVNKLTDDQCEVLYVEIEERLARRADASTAEPVEPRALGQPKTTSAPSITEAKRLAAEAVEHDQLSRLMDEADGCVTDAAELAGMDRSNLRKRLQHLGLRAPGKKKPGPKYTDQILKLLDEDRTGLRASEIAKKIRLAMPNVFSLLKYLERRERIQRHGERHNTLWTLPGVEPLQRLDTISAIIVDVLASNGVLPMDRRHMERQVEKILRDKGRTFNATTLRTETTRLIEKGVVAFHGANEHGPMFALTVSVTEGGSDLN
jgi:hypothetical protein